MRGVYLIRKILVQTFVPVLAMGATLCGLLIVALLFQILGPFVIIVVGIAGGAGAYHWFFRRSNKS